MVWARFVSNFGRAARVARTQTQRCATSNGQFVSLLAGGTIALAAGTALADRRCASLEEKCQYTPPLRWHSSFKSIPQGQPNDDAGKLAWAIKQLDVKLASSVLQKNPHAATLVDTNDESLFHLAATESERYSNDPQAASEMMRILLKSGWPVVDMKNKNGERADVIAARVMPTGIVKQLLAARSRDFFETLRYESPLTLIRDASPVAYEWDYILDDDRRRSWAGVLPKAVDENKCNEWFKVASERAAWHDLPDVPRKVAWFVAEEFADTPYRYSGLEYPAVVFPPWMEEIREVVCEKCGIPPEDYPESCNVNLYANHEGEVGWHSDDEVLFQGLARDTRIVSFSLGSPRGFCFRLQGTTETLDCVPLGNGDIMTMEGLFQKHYKHSVPASAEPTGPRINFTFRWIKVKADAVDAKTIGKQ